MSKRKTSPIFFCLLINLVCSLIPTEDVENPSFTLNSIKQFENGECIGRVTIERREATQKGFHRILETQISFEKLNLKEEEECNILQLEDLSSSFYVDKYQLRDEEEFNFRFRSSAFQSVRTIGVIDLEKPSYLSNSNFVFVFIQFEKGPKSINFTSKFPIHLRYHSPHPSKSFETATIEGPNFYLKCGNENWRKLCSNNDQINPIQIEVPVGNQEEVGMVMAVTTITSIFGCVLLFYYSLANRQ